MALAQPLRAAYLVAVLVEVEGGCHLNVQLHAELLVLLVAVELVDLDVRVGLL